MSTPPEDPLVKRAIDELRRVPVVDADAIRRVVHAAATARITPADEPSATVTTRARSIRVWSAAGLAAAAAIVGFVVRGSWTSNNVDTAPQVAAAPSGFTASAPAPATRFAATGAADVVAIPQQFVFERARVHRVAVVGDFNKWNPTSAPMARSSDGSLWSVIVPILPGRHMYGFMIDDSLFVLDPRAQKARDPDLGTEGSVLVVGRP